MSFKSEKRHAVRVACGYAVELLEKRDYLTIAFDDGRAAPYAEGFNAAVIDFTVARINKADATLDLGTLFVGTATVNSQLDLTLGNGAGAFTRADQDVVGITSVLRTGDFDGDGNVDFFLRNDRAQVFVRRGDGTGRFIFDDSSPFRNIPGIRDFTTADMNGDGRTDIIAVTSGGLFIFRSNGVDGFTDSYSNALTGLAPTVQAVDVDNNGRRDMIFAVTAGSVTDLGVVLQNTDGSFQALKKTRLSASPIQVRAGFFNTDAILDLAVLGSNPAFYNTGSVEMLMGYGNGQFNKVQQQELGVDAKGIAVGDFDLDGRSDVAVTSNRRDAANLTSFYVLRTSLDGTVIPYGGARSTTPADMIQSGDFNNDGKTDVIVREVATRKLRLYLSIGVKYNSIQGTLWNDLNENGVRDGIREIEDDGLGGRIVYVDADDDGIPNPSERFTTTLADGRWELQVPNGTHRVRQHLASGWIQTAPYTNPTLVVPIAQTVTVSGGQVRTGVSFGTADRGDIQGAVYNDYNGNGSFDGFESGIPSIGVYIDSNNDGAPQTGEPIAFTGSDGRYRFDVGTFKTYVVRFLPPGTPWLAPTLTARSIQAGPNSSALNVNFGLTKPATISGRVYNDDAQNGFIDGALDVGVGGLQVFIDTDNDGVLDTGEARTTTSASTDPAAKGRYSFTGLFPRTYQVRLVKPAGYTQVTPSRVNGPSNAGQFTTFAYGGFDTLYTDFGTIRPSTVTGRVFRDDDADGAIDAAEAGIPDNYVYIDYDNDSVPDTTEPQTATDSAGNYTLIGSRAGTFTVRAIRKSGLNATLPSSASLGVNFVQGATVTGRNFGMKVGAFTTAPYLAPVNIPTGANPTALATGDFNADGKADFIVAGNASVGRVYLGQGNGLFSAGQELQIGDSTRYMIAVDVSGDGKPDLVAANDAFDFGASVLIGNGNGTFQNAVGYRVTNNTYGVAAFDFNGDGKRDLAFVGTSDARVAILINKGNGTFNPATFVANPAGGGKSVFAGDVTGDGRADLVVAVPFANAVSVFVGSGTGAFTRKTPDVTGGGINQPSFVTLADFNADGKLDLVALNEFADTVTVKLGNGNGTFATGRAFATGSTPTQVAVLDIDRDGKLDLVVSCRSDGTTAISGGISILRGRGDGTFVDQQVRTAGTSPTAVAVADYDRDGKLDIVAANFFGDDVSFLKNGTPGAPGTIRGTVWNDADVDGNFDAGESGLAGRRVFADVDNDRVYDPGERFVLTASNGTYAFVDLPAGTYNLRTELPATLVQTSPAGNAANTVALAAGQNLTGRNIGLTPVLVVGSYTFDDRSAFYTGTWNRSTPGGQYGGDAIDDGKTGQGTKSVRYDLKLPAAGYYQVAVRWVANANRATNVPVDIRSATNTRTLTLNQKVNGNTWVSVGVYYFDPAGGSVTVRNGSANGFVSADAVRLTPVAAPPTVIKDNADTSGVTITGTWNKRTTPAGFNGINFLDDGNPTTKGGRSVTFKPTLTTGGTYEVFARWTSGTDRAGNARFDIRNAAGTTQTLSVDQRSRGGVWVSLGFFDLNPATASVIIRNDAANGLVVADAVRFVKV